MYTAAAAAAASASRSMVVILTSLLCSACHRAGSWLLSCTSAASADEQDVVCRSLSKRFCKLEKLVASACHGGQPDGGSDRRVHGHAGSPIRRHGRRAGHDGKGVVDGRCSRCFSGSPIRRPGRRAGHDTSRKGGGRSSCFSNPFQVRNGLERCRDGR